MTPSTTLAYAAGLAPDAGTATTGLSLCLPVYNEEDAVADTLRRCLDVRADLLFMGIDDFEVIAVDDGSQDGTAEIISAFPDVRLVRHPVNRGYGAALKTGFAAARFDLIAFLDADGTYPPEHLPHLCAAVLSGSADLVVGTRMAIGRSRVSDSASGMRVFRRDLLELLSPLPDGLNLTPVMRTRAAHERIAVVEVPIPYSERVGDSKLSVARDGARFLKTMVTAALAYNPVRVFGAAGLCGLAIAGVILAGLTAARLQDVTTIGPLGVVAVFVALVAGVGGMSLFAMGACFNYLVSLFYARPIRQGLLNGPLIRRPIEELFLPAGLAAGALGLAIAAGSLWMTLRGWPIERFWLYLTGSAVAMLVGLQRARLVADGVGAPRAQRPRAAGKRRGCRQTGP